MLAALMATASCVFLLAAMASKGDPFDSIQFLYHHKKLGGLISLGALINLLLFFVAIRKNNSGFATGVLIFSLTLVIAVALLKIAH